LIPSIQCAFPLLLAPPQHHEALENACDALESLLLTPRQCSEKYHIRFPNILVSGAEDEDEDLNMMWYAFRNEKPIHDEGEYPDGEEEEVVEDRWRKAWLERIERRE
jgi:hypothetical protein